MAIGYMKLIVGGNLARDMKLETSKNGNAYIVNAIAINRSWPATDEQGDVIKNDKGEIEYETEITWINFFLWEAKAEAAAKNLTKGQYIWLEGRIKPGADGNPDSWTSDDGVSHPQYEMYVERIIYGQKPSGGYGPSEDDEPKPRRQRSSKSTTNAPAANSRTNSRSRTAQRERPAREPAPTREPAPKAATGKSGWDFGNEE